MYKVRGQMAREKSLKKIFLASDTQRVACNHPDGQVRQPGLNRTAV
jgi:hypothetical protein